MVVTTENPRPNGLRHADLLNVPKSKKYFKIEVGVGQHLKTRSDNTGDGSTQFFALEDIKEVHVEYPQSNDIKVDEWIIGYNGGLDMSTGIDFRQSDLNFVTVIDIEGGSIPFRGGNTDKERIVISVPVGELLPYNSCLTNDPCDPVPCKPIVNELIKRIKERQAAGGYKLDEVLEVTPIFSCDNPIGDDEFTFWTIETCDLGDANALANIQKFSSTPVFRIDRRGSISKYQTMLPTGDTPDTVEIMLSSIMAKCDICPDNYTLEESGYVYSFTLDDEGIDQSGTIVIPNAVTGTLIRQGGDSNIGTYTVKTTTLIPFSELARLQTGYPTMRIDLAYESKALCNPEESVLIDWVEGDTCQASSKKFKIDLKDKDCGGNWLSDLSFAYPNYSVELDTSGNITIVTIQLTGDSGEADVVIGGVVYSAIFNTDLATTASDFVTSFKTPIETLTGGTLTSTGSIITFIVDTADYTPVTVTNTDPNLGATITATPQVLDRGCRNQYIMTVPTNITCEECSPVFRDTYTADRPDNFMDIQWKEVEDEVVEDGCACGIRIRGKVFTLNPDICLDGRVPFIEDSPTIRVTAGFAVEGYNGYMNMDYSSLDFKTVHIEQTERKKGRDMLGGNLKQLEREGTVYFNDYLIERDNLKRALLGRESVITDNFEQYVGVTIVMNPSKYTQSFGHTNNYNDISYTYYAPLGKHIDVENEIFRLAAAAGAPIVKSN